MFKIGLVGLPNVGKTTIFNAITKSSALAANYPFATIDPNFGVFTIQDARLLELEKFWNSKKITFSTIEIFDIAGLIKGSNKGLGLGNEFLSHIRRVDAICHVIRSFEDDNILNEGTDDILSNFEIIKLELVLADIDLINKVTEKLKKKKKIEELDEFNFLMSLKKILEEKKTLLDTKISPENEKYIKKYNFLTAKPFFVILNQKNFQTQISWKQIEFEDYLRKENILFANFGFESSEESVMPDNFFFYLTELIKKILQLKSFFTVGKDEVKSWITKNGYNAKECASLIHTDISKGFIAVNVYSFEDWKENKEENILKKEKKIKSEKASYLIKDGDICHFIFKRYS